MDEVKSIQLHTCHLQYVYWVTGMTYDPLELEKDKSTTIPFIVRSNGETGIHVLCASLALQQHLLTHHRCGRFALPSLFRLDGRCLGSDSDPSLRCSRVWSVSEQSGGSRMHAHALHRLEAHLVHDEVPTKECEGDGGVFACSSLQVALHAHRLDSSLSSLNENNLHPICLCEGEL